MKNILQLLLILSSPFIYGQNSLLINDNSYIVIENGGKIVIENPADTAIQTTNGGNIITAAENDEVIWNIGASTGIYTIPWTTVSLVKMPLEVNISTAGVGTGKVTFTTYPTSNMNIPYPAGVTSMNSGVIGNADASLFAIDRFWGIDARGYTTKPSVTLSFTYDVAEIAPTNTITEANLQAQRWNATNDTWENLLFGAQSGSVVNNVVAAPLDFFKNWTLVDNSTPLPVELVHFNAKLLNSRTVNVSWKTVSEINNDYFEVEKSENGTNFYSFAMINGAGNSTSTLNYSTIDSSPYSEVTFYRLKQIDFDGSFNYSEIKSVSMNGFNSAFIYPNPASNFIQVESDFNSDGTAIFQVVDIYGKNVLRQELSVQKGHNQNTLLIQDLPSGNYFLKIQFNNTNYKALKFNKL